MVRLAREAAPDAWPVQADLEALPFRRGALGGGVGAGELPARPDATGCRAALAELHHALAVGAPVAPHAAARATTSGAFPDDDFPGRFFARVAARRAAPTCSSAPGSTVDDVRGRRRRADWLDVRATRAAHAARHRRARDAAARVRPEPERVLGRRRRRLRPARATASGPPRSPPGS